LAHPDCGIHDEQASKRHINKLSEAINFGQQQSTIHELPDVAPFGKECNSCQTQLKPRKIVLYFGMVFQKCYESSTAQDIRDYTRCRQSEDQNNEVYTFDLRESKVPSHRHITGSWNCFHRSRDSTNLSALKGKISEVTIDFTWMPPTYCDIRLGTAFFQKTLPTLGKEFLVRGGKIYLPLTELIFAKVLSLLASHPQLFLLRFIFNMDENSLYKASSSLPEKVLHGLKKQPACHQIDNFGCTLERLSKVAGSSEILENFPVHADGKVKYLCLVKTSPEPTDRFAPFSAGILVRTPLKRNRRETSSLIEGAVSFLNREDRLTTAPPVTRPNICSPYHKEFLNGQYGRSKNMTKKLALPRFDPNSVGGLDLTPGQWKCQVCSFNNPSERAVPNCAGCSTTPSRRSKKLAPAYNFRALDMSFPFDT
jgi:hypothetical protein